MKKIKLYIMLIFIACLCKGYSQEISEMKLETGYSWFDCGHFSNFPQLSTVVNKVFSGTILHTSKGKKCGFFSILVKRDNSHVGYCLSTEDTDLSIVKHFPISNNEIQFFANFRTLDSPNNIAVVTYNTLLNSISSANLVLPDPGSSWPIELIDVAQIGNEYYLLIKTETNYLSSTKYKTAVIKYAEGKIIWSKIFNSIAPINSEFPLSISVMHNGNIFIAGKYSTPRDSSYKSMFIILDGQADMVTMKSMHFFTSDHSWDRTIVWNAAKVNGRRLHLFSQALDEEGNPGSILATMLDTSGNLLTWRNYDFAMTVEDAIIEDNAFILSGRANELSDKNSFFSVRINASNAIVEGLYSILEGNFYPSITGSSLSYNAAEASIESIVLSSGSPDNKMFFIKGDRKGESVCTESLTYGVLKDPLELTDLPYTIKDFACIVAPIVVSIEKLTLEFEEVCNIINTKDNGPIPYAVFPNPVQSQLNIKGLQGTENLRIFNSIGYEIATDNDLIDNIISVENYPDGLYFMSIEEMGIRKQYIPFLKN